MMNEVQWPISSVTAMLFVHLTDARNVPRIRKNGLRLAGDDSRRGLYCVPLLEVAQVREMSADSASPESGMRWWNEATTVKSTLRLWKWLMAQKRYTRPVAIVFKAPKPIWPADLYLHFPREDPFAEKFLAWCNQRQIPTVHLQNSYLCQEVNTPFVHGCCHLQVTGEAHLGQLISGFINTGNRQWIDGLHDPFEVVFHQRIPSKFINRVVPLSQRNVTFKTRKAKARFPESHYQSDKNALQDDGSE